MVTLPVQEKGWKTSCPLSQFMTLCKIFQLKAQSNSDISRSMTWPHLPYWELWGHLFHGRITSLRSRCRFLPSAMLVVWLTKRKKVLAKPVISQKLDHLQRDLLAFPLLLLPPSDASSWYLLFSTDVLFVAQGLDQHKPFSLAIWRKMLECLLQKSKHWFYVRKCHLCDALFCKTTMVALPHSDQPHKYLNTGWQQLKINSSKLFMPGGLDFQAKACGLDYGISPQPQGKRSGKPHSPKRVGIARTFAK